MDAPRIRFEDGAAYEKMMGRWSRLAGEKFLDWAAPSPGLQWLDVGCGNGAFTQLVVDRCAPASADGIDPSEGQLSFARIRPASRLARFHQGDAMALPFPDASFDVATMALVIFFVPEPAKGVAEMARVVRPGGMVAAYAWDMLGGGFPLHPMHEEMRALGIPIPMPPSTGASRIDDMRELWKNAGLVDVRTTEIVAERSFADFEECWEISRSASSLATTIDALAPGDAEQLRNGLRSRLRPHADGRVICTARANAVKGRVPA